MTEILYNYDIKKHTTFKIGGKVAVAAFPETIEELTNLRNNYKDYGLMHIQIPHDLDFMYYDRMLEDGKQGKIGRASCRERV